MSSSLPKSDFYEMGGSVDGFRSLAMGSAEDILAG